MNSQDRTMNLQDRLMDIRDRTKRDEEWRKWAESRERAQAPHLHSAWGRGVRNATATRDLAVSASGACAQNDARHPDATDEDFRNMAAGKAVAFNAGKTRVDLIPADVLLAIGEVFRFGAEKYSDRNWEGGGLNYGAHVGSVLRHIFRWQIGEEEDPESGLHPLDHAIVRLMMLRADVLRRAGVDDRSQI